MLAISILAVDSSISIASAQQKKQITLTAVLAEPKNRWDVLLKSALDKLRERHPDVDIQIKPVVLPYNSTRTHILTLTANQTPVDIISVDQIWLGDFAEKGILTDLTDRVQSWGRLSDWYPQNFAGGLYNHKVFGIWAWTDVRGMWYWKDLLKDAGVNPESLTTWDGYIASAKKLNAALRPQGIEGVHLVSLWRNMGIQQKVISGFLRTIVLQVLER